LARFRIAGCDPCHIARADFARMRSDVNYQRLAAAVGPDRNGDRRHHDVSVPHRAMTGCYLHAVLTRDPDGTITIFPDANCILSRKALTEIVSS